MRYTTLIATIKAVWTTSATELSAEEAVASLLDGSLRRKRPVDGGVILKHVHLNDLVTAVARKYGLEVVEFLQKNAPFTAVDPGSVLCVLDEAEMTRGDDVELTTMATTVATDARERGYDLEDLLASLAHRYDIFQNEEDHVAADDGGEEIMTLLRTATDVFAPLRPKYDDFRRFPGGDDRSGLRWVFDDGCKVLAAPADDRTGLRLRYQTRGRSRRQTAAAFVTYSDAILTYIEEHTD